MCNLNSALYTEFIESVWAWWDRGRDWKAVRGEESIQDGGIRGDVECVTEVLICRFPSGQESVLTEQVCARFDL